MPKLDLYSKILLAPASPRNCPPSSGEDLAGITQGGQGILTVLLLLLGLEFLGPSSPWSGQHGDTDRQTNTN